MSTQPVVNDEQADFQPILLLEVDLASPLADLSLISPATGEHYTRATVLVRAYTYPIGEVHITLDDGVMPAAGLADLIWRELKPEITAYLTRYGLPTVERLDAAALSELPTPGYMKEREALLADSPFVSIVVTTRNRPGVAETLRSLMALDYPNYEIVVVDNAPTTYTADQLVAELCTEFPNMRYVREDRAGLCWARNCGLDAAQGEITVFTDDDILADADWLTALVEGFSAGDNVVCVTGLIQPRELDTPVQVWCEEHGGFGKGFTPKIYDLDENRPDDPLYPYRLSMLGSGANMAFKTEVLKALGGTDPALGAGTPTRSGAEFPPFYKVIKNHYQLVYQPGAIIYHSHHREYERFQGQFYGYGVGFGAFLTKCILEDPRTLFDLMRRLPYGLFFLLSPNSPKHESKTATYPRELDRMELKGLFYGPIAYLRSRRQTRQKQAQHTSG